MDLRGHSGAVAANYTWEPRASLQILVILMASVLAAGVLAAIGPSAVTADLLRTRSAATSQAPGSPETGAPASYGNVPLSFVPNAGQTDDQVLYQASGAGYSFFFTQRKALFALSKPSGDVTLGLRFLGASPHAEVIAQDRQKGLANFLSGSDPSSWQTGLPTYNTVVYRDLWPGIDMRFSGANGQLKYEFLVHRGASPSDIRLAYAGSDRLSVGSGGAMTIHTASGSLRDARPISYQWIGGRKVPVASRYSLGRGTSYGFALGSYDPRVPLTVDPSLKYSTFIGGGGRDEGTAIFVEGGKAYVTGQTHSSNYPSTDGAFQENKDVGADVFVTQLNQKGSELIYSTFIGGDDVDVGEDIFVKNGEAFVTGVTFSGDFPATPGAYETSHSGEDDGFALKLNGAGSDLVYSTFLGGLFGDQGRGIDVYHDRAYVTGVTFSADFPTTEGAHDEVWNGLEDAFVTKLNPTGSELEYSTFLGGLLAEEGQDVAVEHGEAYVTGFSESPGIPAVAFPTTPDAYDPSHNGSRDVFVTKFNSSGSDLVYSTFVGGAMDEEGFGIAVQSREAYVTGYTRSADFPTIEGARDDSYNGSDDVFVLKLNRVGSHLLYSTYLGGTNLDRGEEVVVHAGRAYVPGQTNSTNFPVTANAYDQVYNGGVRDAFVTVLNGTGSALQYSTYLGGGARDQARDVAVAGSDIFLTGFTTSSNFPTTPGAWDTTLNGDRDVFVTRL